MSRCGPRAPARISRAIAQFRLRIAALQILRPRPRHAEIVRRERPPRPPSRARISKASVGPVVVISSRPSEPCTTNPRSSPSAASAPAINSAACARRRARQLRGGARRIGQRPQQIEHRPHLQLHPHRMRVPRRRVKRRREQKADADFADGARASRGAIGDAHAHRLQQVGAAALARYGPVAMLGHAHAGAGHHERRHRRNIEGGLAVAAGAAGIQQRLAGKPGVDRLAPSAAWRARSPTSSSTVSPFMRSATRNAGDLRRRDARPPGCVCMASQASPLDRFRRSATAMQVGQEATCYSGEIQSGYSSP